MISFMGNMSKVMKKIFIIYSSVLLVFAISIVIKHYATNPRVLSLMTMRRHDYVPNNSARSGLFYGVNVDMSQLLPGSQNYVVNSKGEDLIDVAAHLGINMFRITNATPPSDTNSDAVYTKQ